MAARQPTPDMFAGKADIMGEILEAKTDAALIRAQLRYDYGQLGDLGLAIQDHAVEIKRHERRVTESVVEAGRHLIAVKESLEHGQWEDWLQVEFHMSDRTARTMMSVAERFNGKTEIISDLQTTVLGLLASPSVPDAAVEEVIDEAAQEKMSVTRARQIIQRHKDLERAKKQAEMPAPGYRPEDDGWLCDNHNGYQYYHPERGLATTGYNTKREAAAAVAAGQYGKDYGKRGSTPTAVTPAPAPTDNRAYAVAAGLTPADAPAPAYDPKTSNTYQFVSAAVADAKAVIAEHTVSLDALPVVDSVTAPAAGMAATVTRLDRLYHLRHVYQAGRDGLQDVLDLMPELSGVIRMVDAALRTLVERLDRELGNE